MQRDGKGEDANANEVKIFIAMNIVMGIIKLLQYSTIEASYYQSFLQWTINSAEFQGVDNKWLCPKQNSRLFDNIIQRTPENVVLKIWYVPVQVVTCTRYL